MKKAKLKYKPTWADHLYTLLMQQPSTENNVELASSAVGAWLGEKTSTMSVEDFEKLQAQAAKELMNYAYQIRRELVLGRVLINAQIAASARSISNQRGKCPAAGRRAFARHGAHLLGMELWFHP